VRYIARFVLAGFAAAAVTATLVPAQPPSAETVQPVAPEEAEAPGVVIAHKFRRGDRFELACRQSQSSAKQPRAQRSQYRVLVEVLDEIEDGQVVIAWTQEIPPPPDNADPMVQAISAAMNGLRMEFPVSVDGEIGIVRNYADLKARIDTTISAYIEARVAKGLAPELAEKARAMAAEMYDDPEQASATLTADAAQFFGTYGWELDPGVEIEQETEVVIPMTGTPLMSTLRVSLVNYDAGKATMDVKQVQTIDPEVFRASLIEAMSGMAEQTGKPFDDKARAEIAGAECSFEWTASCRYNQDTGMIERAVFEKRVRVGDENRNDSLDFRLVEFKPAAPAGSAP